MTSDGSQRHCSSETGVEGWARVARKKPSLAALCLAFLALTGCGDQIVPQQAPATPPPIVQPVEPATPSRSVSASKIPDYVWEAYAYIREHSEAPPGFVGGRSFENRERNLPQKTASGKFVRYREWDVHPKEKGVNRGAERLVTGDDGSAWYSDDHYQTFTRIDTMSSEGKASP